MLPDPARHEGHPTPGPSSESSSGPSSEPSLAPWQRPAWVLVGTAAAMYLLVMWLDAWLLQGESSAADVDDVLRHLFALDEAKAQHALSGLGEMMAAILGLALTVSSIIVQLAATRFTPHVTTLFFRARTNIVTWGFFVTGTIFVIWINASIGHGFVPQLGVGMALLVLTASLALLFPYFGYVFHFLDPDSIIGRITHDGREATRPRPKRPDTLRGRQQRYVAAVERLADIALNAIGQRDKHNASSAINALCELHQHYATNKAALAEGWFRIDEPQRRNADFSSLSAAAAAELEDRRIWAEWKLLRQYQLLFGESLDKMNDLTHLIATDTRRIGEAAADRGDFFALDLSVKFFNTYLRATINANNPRTAYNVLHQYRRLAECLLAHANADSEAGERARQVAGFFGYYSELASRCDLPFVVEVIAHDLAELCATAHQLELSIHTGLLEQFLGVDDPTETRARDRMLTGVRRAQVKLATTYLVRGDAASARAVHRDLAQEPAPRLEAIRRHLLALDTPEFWEVNDRGTNFDYLSPEQKRMLARFFAWFPQLATPAQPSPPSGD